ncbi:MAG: glycosyltransferase family 4 protein [Ruminococcaceae bacterium]|nr:glycosyltransferase family 4 protein [Oscillospiraceae bacterium]
MKIYEIGTGYTPIPAQMGAATEIVVEELTRAFIKNGENAEIIDICAKKREECELPISEVKVPDKFSGTDVSLGIMHKLKRVVYSISLAKHLKNILKNEEDKVVLHFHNQYNLFFALKLIPKKLLKKATIAYTVHSYIWGTEWEEIEKTVKKKYFQEITCVKNADIVLVLNDITIDHFVNRLGVCKDKIHKIKNGVNIDRYAPLSKPHIDELKEKNGLGGKKVIFQVGSICERKNQFGSVKMLTEYLKANSDVVYMYAGGIIDAEYQQSILEYAKENGIYEQIKYLGELAPGKQLNEYYNIADCSVFTSTLESFGLVIIEAISSGTPVVLGSNLMFDLNCGYSMYNTEEEFVSMVDAALCGGKISRDEVFDVLNKYSWEAVARTHSSLFTAAL